MAAETYKKFQKVAGHYNNTLDSHLKGKLGEIAVEKYLLSTRGADVIDSAFRDISRDLECDIYSKNVRIEVKTWTRKFWRELGRCISVEQLPKLSKKADVVIWCVVEPEKHDEREVSLVGWNWVNEIEQAPRRYTGPHGGRQVDNHQLDESQIRPFTSLGS